jgi:Mitochondrial carrier protein
VRASVQCRTGVIATRVQSFGMAAAKQPPHRNIFIVLRAFDGRPAASAPGGKSARVSGGEVFLTSAVAKLGATVATYPLLLVKQRLQSAGKQTAEHLRYNGTLDAVARILKEEGVCVCVCVCVCVRACVRACVCVGGCARARHQCMRFPLLRGAVP